MRRPGRGRRAIEAGGKPLFAAFDQPPLRPLTRLARRLASLRTRPPSLPSATALHQQYFDDTRSNVMNRRVEQFNALGQEDRLKIFRLLVLVGPEGNCVDDIKRRLKMAGSTLSHHLDALTRSGLLTARRAGRFIYYAVNWRETANLIRFLTEDCCADMHTKLAPSEAPAAAPSVSGAGAACCAEEMPNVPRQIGRRAKTPRKLTTEG